jgi:nucleotide-binding universal stress UspA family protein
MQSEHTLIATQDKNAPAFAGPKSILFTTDFSPCSLAVLPWVVAVARRCESKVYLAHVIPPQPYPMTSPDADPSVESTWHDKRSRMEELSKSAQLADIPHESLLSHGNLSEVLTKMIEDYRIGMIVAGTHGRHGLKRFVLGSVAEEIIRVSPCPVLTMGPHVPANFFPEMPVRHILYPTDLSEESFAAVPYVFSFAFECTAHLTVLHVLSPAKSAKHPSVENTLRDQLERRLPAEARSSIQTEVVIREGEPLSTIFRTARQSNADLILLGVRKAPAWATHLTSSIAPRIMAEAECPVLTVRAGAVA